MKMATNAKRTVPYSKAATIEAFFDLIEHKKAPDAIDSDWAKAQELEPTRPTSIPGLLGWLGVINEEGIPDRDRWEGIRHVDTRQETVRELIEEAYGALFDASEVTKEPREQLTREFARVYGLGDARERVTCFLKLCQVAGLDMAANRGPSTPREANPRSTGQAKDKGTPRDQEQKVRTQRPLEEQGRKEERRSGATGESSLTINVNLGVEIPADWDEHQVSERLKALAQAVSEFRSGGA